MEQEEPFQAERTEESAISWDHDGLEYSELHSNLRQLNTNSQSDLHGYRPDVDFTSSYKISTFITSPPKLSQSNPPFFLHNFY